MEAEICTKMLKELSGKLRAKFPATTPGFLTASRPGRRSMTAAKRKEKEKKERGKNSKNLDSGGNGLRKTCRSLLSVVLVNNKDNSALISQAYA